jgi:hypothetical protein
VLCVRVEGGLTTFYRCFSFLSLLFVEICWALFVSKTSLGRVWLLPCPCSGFFVFPCLVAVIGFFFFFFFKGMIGV